MGRSIATVLACTLGALALAGPLAAASAPVKKVTVSAGYRAPRGPDNVHPDLNGVWQALTPANWNIEAHGAQSAFAERPGPAGPVPAKSVLALGAIGSVPPTPGIVVGGVIPYKPDALKTRDDNKAHAIERDPEVKCYLPGVPRATYMPYPFRIFQSDKSMLIDYEYDGAARNILCKDPGPAPVDAWMGQSVAHWEGDTLVIKVTGLLDQSWFDRAGNFHGDQLTVVERYTPTSPYTIKYEAEITDPDTFTRPWKIELTLYKSVGPDVQLGQFKCVEFVEELMYGDLRREPLK